MTIRVFMPDGAIFRDHACPEFWSHDDCATRGDACDDCNHPRASHQIERTEPMSTNQIPDFPNQGQPPIDLQQAVADDHAAHLKAYKGLGQQVPPRTIATVGTELQAAMDAASRVPRLRAELDLLLGRKPRAARKAAAK